jgi:hypothetical protein
MEAEIEDSDRYAIDIDYILGKVRKVINSKHIPPKEVIQSSQNRNPNAQEFVYMNSDSSNSIQSGVQFKS